MSHRANDPDTSIAASALIQEHTSRIQQKILKHLAQYPHGLTTRELSLHTGIDFATVTPRMRPMAEKEWVLMTDKKKRNPIGQGFGRVWVITDRGYAAILWTSITKI